MDNSKTIKLPKKKYGVIYADPPWSFRTYSNKGKDRSPEKHYNTMSLKDICNMPVKDIADKDCVLLMWVCDPMLDQALKVISHASEKGIEVKNKDVVIQNNGSLEELELAVQNEWNKFNFG